jgi:putative ABC transport system permease protein
VSSQARVLIGVLGAAVGCVLLIACANVANLLMARAVGRQREIALRAALGAGRLRILRQLLIESLLLAVSGGAAGLALAVWSLQALLAIAPANLPIPRLDQLRIDGTVIGFVIALSFLTAALFGIVPGWNAARSDINSVLKQGGVASSPSRQWFRGTLIAAETALSVVLLTAAGQLISTWVSLLNVSPGIRTAGVFAFSLPAPDREMAAHERQSFYEAQLQRTSDIPGVRGVALADRMPFTGAEWLQNFQARTPMRAVARRVSPGYFDALGIAVRAGRVFSERDTASSPKVVMINETAARRYWPDGNALGQIIRQTGEHDRTLGPSETATIIGIVADSRQRLDSPPLPQILFSYSQVGGYRDVVLILRSQVRAGDVAAAVRATARRLDRGQPVGDPAPLDRERIESIAPQRFQTMLVSGFAAVALLLACAGIYGVVAFTVGQQTREIGIRMALGATGHRTVRYVVGRNGRWIVAGMLLGAFGSLGTNRILRAQFPGTAALDWLIIATAASCLCASALTAMGLPARRAAGVDPALALRQ